MFQGTVMYRAATQQSTAPYNRMAVLDIIRRRGRISRKELQEVIDLSPQAIANITQELEARGLVVSRRAKIDKSRGQPPMTFEINPHGGEAIGISLEAHKLSAALVNLAGEMVDRIEIDNDARNVAGTIDAMTGLASRLRGTSHTPDAILGIGIALPGPLNAPHLTFVGPTALDGWTDYSILGTLTERTGLNVFYNIDSVASALGESLFGVAQDIASFFYLHFGIGLGGTLIVDRAPYDGARGNATEIGHIPVVPDGRPCYCGSRGCLERYLSLHSLSEAIIGDAGIELGNDQVMKLLTRKDARLQSWCETAAHHLRHAICTIENMLDSATIVIGGTAPSALVRHIVAMAQPLLPSVRSGIEGQMDRITLSARQEDSSILGAAVLPIYEMLSPGHDAGRT